MPQHIYCDEAGYSGNNLLDADQPFFTYASVAVDDAEARETVAATLRDFRIDGGELKGRGLVRHSRGRKAVRALIVRFRQRALVSAFHKRYCLATKFFEYVFEPVLAKQNSIFYGCGFHRFVANVLFFEALSNNHRADAALRAFQDVARGRDAAGVPRIFASRVHGPGYSEVLDDVEAFVELNRAAIAADVARHAGGAPLHRWLLDLSLTAAFSLLASWGERHESLLVTCDESKPLYECREAFDVMIGRTDTAVVEVEGKRQSVIFNLAEPLRFERSDRHPGLQIADVFASALAYALRKPQEGVSRDWLALLEPSASEYSIFPDARRIALDSESGYINRVVLRALVLRSHRREDLFAGMPALIEQAAGYWHRHRPVPRG